MAEQSHHPTRQSDRIRERTQLLKIREDVDADSLAQDEERARLQRDQGHCAQGGNNGHNLAEAAKTRILASPRRSKACKSTTLEINKTKVKANFPSLRQLAGGKRKGGLGMSPSEPEGYQDDSGDDYLYEEYERTPSTQKRMKSKRASFKAKPKTSTRPTLTKVNRKGPVINRRKLLTARGQKVPLEEMTLHSKNAERSRALVESQPPANDIQLSSISIEAWIQHTISSMLQGFSYAKEHHNTPLSSIIYWMPRTPSPDHAAVYMTKEPDTPEGQLNFWTIPLKSPSHPWETAPTIQQLQTDQVAHWLHISMQDLVGFLSLCTVREANALNAYLYFRVELVKFMRAIPCASQWIYSGEEPLPGGHVYELLLRLRSLDDEQQRLLSWALHAFIRQRRDVHNLSILPRNAPYRFNDRNHRALFEYLQKAWSMRRSKTSPLLEWTARSLFPGWIDSRSLGRWHLIENPNLAALAADQAHGVLEADMQFLVKVETERNHYILGDMAAEEARVAVADHRDQQYPHMYGHHPMPFSYNQGKVVDKSNAWWIHELRLILLWHQQHTNLPGLLREPSTMLVQNMVLKQYSDVLQAHRRMTERGRQPLQSPSPTPTCSSSASDVYQPVDTNF
ncbi:hypothetical protein BGZ72_000363 [Mortierella alpina]|nr:hypothetical protein BGZ72_000363 [Mortierella alpina]